MQRLVFWLSAWAAHAQPRKAVSWGGCVIALALAGCTTTLPAGPTWDEETHYRPHLRQRSYWPTQAWQVKDPAAVGINKAALQKAVDYAFQVTGDEKDRKGIRTEGLVVIKDGYLVQEHYARGYSKDRRHLSWSVSKSFVNAAFGRAIQKGLVKLEDKASSLCTSLQGGGKDKITIRNLLQMSSGLAWMEGYEASPLKSSVLAMLYTSGRQDMGHFAARVPMAYQPGTFWYYSSGTSNLLMALLRDILKGEKALEDFLWKEVFDKIGMRDVTWERDGRGVFVGSSYLYARPRDLARFGYLYLNDGRWDGQRLFPEGWVKFTTSTAPADPKGEYGAHWWLNAGRSKPKIQRRWPDVPADAFSAQGHWGQYIYVLPSQDLVVVRTGDDRDKTFQSNTLLKLILASLSSSPSSKPSSTPSPTP